MFAEATWRQNWTESRQTGDKNPGEQFGRNQDRVVWSGVGKVVDICHNGLEDPTNIYDYSTWIQSKYSFTQLHLR